MTRDQQRSFTFYGAVLDAVADGALVITSAGVIAEPEFIAQYAEKIMSRMDSGIRRRTLDVLAAYYIERFPNVESAAVMANGLARLIGDVLSTTTMRVRPVVRVCCARIAAVDRGDTPDAVEAAHRVINAYGGLKVPCGDAASLDLACMYHMRHYLLADPSDQIGLLRFVHAHREVLSAPIFSDVVMRSETGVLEYIESGTGIVGRAFTLAYDIRALGQRLVETDAFERLLREGSPHRDRIANRLVQRGFMPKLPSGVQFIALPAPDDSSDTKY